MQPPETQTPPSIVPPDAPPPRQAWKGYLLLLIVFFAGGVIGYAAHTMPQSSTSALPQPTVQATTPPTEIPTVAPTPTPTETPSPTLTPVPKWITTQTFEGLGLRQTKTFLVSNDWKLLWSCDPSSFYGHTYNLIVTVYTAEGKLSDIILNTICQSDNDSGETMIHEGGPIYLVMNSEAKWKLVIQEQN